MRDDSKDSEVGLKSRENLEHHRNIDTLQSMNNTRKAFMEATRTSGVLATSPNKASAPLHLCASPPFCPLPHVYIHTLHLLASRCAMDASHMRLCRQGMCRLGVAHAFVPTSL